METNEESGKSWDDARKSALVAQIVSGRLSVKAACQRHELSAETIQDWVRVFRRTMLQALDEHLRQTFLIQGVDAALLGSAEYTGTLDDIPIPDLIQTFQLGGKDGVISVTREDERSQIWCEKGEIVDAESGRLRGEAALYRILDFDRGRVFADFRSEPRTRTIELPSNVLLLEAARRKDECARLLDRLGEASAIYRPAAGASAVSTTAAEREVLALCDGERAIRDVLEESELGDLEGLAAIANLVEREYLLRDGTSLVPPEPSRAMVVSKRTPRSVVSFSPTATSARAPKPTRRGGLLSVVVAGALLGGLVWVGVAAFERDRTPVPSSAASLPTALAPSAPATFSIDSSIEPSDAELWLDGVLVGKGHLRRELPRDGAPHELRVTLAGFAPTTLLFVDAAPPAFIPLEKLQPAPRPPAPALERAALAPAVPATASPPKANPAAPEAPRPRRAPLANAAKGERAPTSERPGSAAAALQRANVPRIQIIGDDTPVVQVIE